MAVVVKQDLDQSWAAAALSWSPGVSPVSGLPDPGLRSAQQGEVRSAPACLEPLRIFGSLGEDADASPPARTVRLEIKRSLGAGLVHRVSRYHAELYEDGVVGGVRKGGRRGCRHQGWLPACLVEKAWQLHAVKPSSLHYMHPQSDGLCIRRAAACPSDDL